jgi:flagellar biosynthesis protein
LRLAEQHGVHVAEDPILAETLSYLQLEEEIPEEVYRSVAAILSWVYYLQGRTPPTG